MQPVPITTEGASVIPADGKVYSIQHFVIKFDIDLRLFSGFLRLPPPIKLTAEI